MTDPEVERHSNGSRRSIKRVPLVDRFWMNVRKSEGCWLWEGGLSRGGYGAIRSSGKMRRAHRLAWELYYSAPVPEGIYVLHSCDQPRCVSPLHLRLGTHSENMADRKSRRREARGEHVGRAKLTSENVLEIRESTVSAGKLAKVYGVSDVTICNVRNMRYWKHVQ